MKKAPTTISPVAVKDDLIKRLFLAINDNIDTIFGRKVGSSTYVTTQDLVDWGVIIRHKDTYIAKKTVDTKLPDRSNQKSLFRG